MKQKWFGWVVPFQKAENSQKSKSPVPKRSLKRQSFGDFGNAFDFPSFSVARNLNHQPGCHLFHGILFQYDFSWAAM